MPITKSQRAAGVKSTRKGVVTRVAGQAKDNSDGPTRGSNPKVNAINEARYANIQAGKSAYSGSAAAKGQIGDTAMGGFSKAGSINSSQVTESTAPLGSTARTNELLGTEAFDPATGAPTAPSPMPTPQTGSIQNGLAEQQQTAFANAQAQVGDTPIDSASQARGIMNSYLPPPEPDTSIMDQMLSEDKGWQEMQELQKEYFDPREQKTSLMDTYKKMYKQSGLEDLDEEIIDAQTIIDGTEDDIRNEVQAAGGMGTDSQVQAMALARNKSLLKNYNNLVSLREMKANNLNTMMNLAEKDRAYADAKFDKMLNFQMQVLDYKNKFVTNTRDQLNKMATTLGLDGMYQMYSQDPRQLGFAEKILGLPAGGMIKAAQQAQQDRLRMIEKENLQLDVLRSNLATDSVQRANIQSQISERQKAAQPTGPSPYQQERAFRTVQSVQELALKVKQNPGIFGRTASLPLPGFLRSDAYRNFKTELDTLKANISFGELQAMREASKTGGALGNVANQELELLQATLGGLNMNQTPENFNAQLSKVYQSITRWQNAQQSVMEPVPIMAPNGEEIIITDM